jgi:hypothetical protein
LLAVHARTCRSRRWAFARAAAVSGNGDRVRARNDRASSRDLPRISFHGGTMTAYLISLALAGLVAIVLWEMLS